MITPATLVRRKPDVMTAEVDGEIVLMSLKDGMYFGLNAVGSDIWRRLEASVRIDALCEVLAAAYVGDRAQIERDVLDLLERLAARDLLEITA